MKVSRQGGITAANQGGTAKKNFSPLTEGMFCQGRVIFRRKKTMMYNGVNFDTYLKEFPNDDGFFGKYGG